MGFVLRLVRVFVADRFDLQEREEPLLFLRRANLARDDVAGLQIEPADLGRRNVNVLGTRQIVEAL